eukprot:CCRYP_004691-RA/>CCRYP_004691-RA protein AED:0.20 eAED:0.20 QI:138/0.5/0.66/1/1/1/3/1616/783
MSSQESSAVLKCHPIAPAAAASGPTRSSKLKRRRRHKEPDRLDWLGGNSSNDDFRVSPSEARVISLSNPQPTEEYFVSGGGGDGGGGTQVPWNGDAVDLTADSDGSFHNDAEKTYECARCTLVNPIGETNCQVCGARRCSVRKPKSRYSKRILEDESDLCRTDGTKRNHAATKSNREPLHHVSKRQPPSNNESSRPLKSTSKESSQLWKWTHSQSSVNPKPKQPTTTKKAKQSSTKATTSTSITSQLWIDKHTPQTAAELCIAPKKIDEVRQWLRTHISARQSRRSNGSNTHNNVLPGPYEAPLLEQGKLMILVGSPGIGKSTLVKVLAKELKLQLLMWNDAHVDYAYEQMSMIREGGYLPYQSQLASFEEFLVGAGVGLDSLDVEVQRNESGMDEYSGSVILIEDLFDFQYVLPGHHADRNIMERHLQRTIVPTVFIFSDVYEGRHKPEDLERLIPNRMLYSLLVQILPIQPATKSKMKKCIESIAKSEGFGRLSSDFIEELHLSSGGDIRHAIYALQFQYGSKGTRAISHKSGTTRRDVKLSTFHALGKLLYAKRKPRCEDSPPSTPSIESCVGKWDDGRGPLEFIPEQVLDQTDMGTGSAISFLAYHSPEFFTDITELSHAFERISDAGSLLDRFGASDGPFPMDYASSLGGRAIADANKNPAPSQFRQLSAPKVFDVLKKQRENDVKMDQLRKRLSVGSQKIAVNENIGSAHQFVTDSLPYLKNIIPHDVNYALANLHSYAKESNTNLSQIDQNNDSMDKVVRHNVLLDDDLIDDDDGW